MEIDRYTVGHSTDASPDELAWFVIDELTEEIVATFALGKEADAFAANLNDNWDEEQGMRILEQNFTRYWEGN
jgi:hypothetical protein